MSFIALVGGALGIKRTLKKLFSRYNTIIQKRNWILANLQFKLKKSYLTSYPVKLTIDPCNYCNLRCVLCPVGTQDQGRKQSVMSFQTFKKILDECGPYLWEIDLYNWGEPFLNKDVFEMIKYARSMKINVNVSSNLNYFNEDICISLIKSGLNKLIISLDGASQESVERYQKGCNFNRVISNIEQIVSMKEKLKSHLPLIHWRFLVHRYNENEIHKARELSKKLKIDQFKPGRLSCDMGKEIFLANRAKYENAEPWLPKDEALSTYNYSEKCKKNIKNICKILWFESAIQPDGSVSPCCAVWPQEFDFGNINDSSFQKIWNNKKYQDARRISRGDDISINAHICYICKMNNSSR